MSRFVAVLPLLAVAACNPVMMAATDEELESQRVRARYDLGQEFEVEIVDGLWILASNGDSHTRQKAAQTLQEMSEALTRTYFERKPRSPVRVYMFKDKDSYQGYCDRSYTEPPRTPFGFYMPRERKIVVNVNTGLGTLAHEMVHPLMEADFPGSPAWFNEGFASLFEQSKYTPGKEVQGLVNWRIRSLKRALARPNPPMISETMALDKDDFYSKNAGVNYAVARFLCLYLQEKGLLVRFYKEFREGYREDRTGQAILESVTGRRLKLLEVEWRAWVATLPEE